LFVRHLSGGAVPAGTQPAAEAVQQRVVNALGRRRLAHAAEVLELAGGGADEQLAGFAEEAIRDEKHQEFLARVIVVAQDMADQDKRRALARSLAAAIAGEDAVLDEEFLLYGPSPTLTRRTSAGGRPKGSVRAIGHWVDT